MTAQEEYETDLIAITAAFHAGNINKERFDEACKQAWVNCNGDVPKGRELVVGIADNKLIVGHVPTLEPRPLMFNFSGRKKKSAVYIRPDQLERLQLLSSRTKVPVAEYIRQGVELILEKHRE